MPSKRTLFLPPVLSLAFTFATPGALAQTDINDVHIAPREEPITRREPITLATDYGPASYPPGSLIRARADLVLVPVTITDDYNRPVIGLKQDNFQLFENKKPQAIKNFSSEDAPVSIGIIVDTSGSMSHKLDRAREAVAQFCDASNLQDEFFLITFADEPRLATDFTNNPQNIENDLLTTRSRGRTSLLDSIYMGIRQMRNARYSRRALLILSDGGDNHSRYSEHDLHSIIKESDVVIYAVGTYEQYVNTQEELLGPELLRSITALTGGQAYSLTNVNDMPSVTRGIGIRLRHQYLLAYQPPASAQDKKWHKISVKLRLPKKFAYLHVFARPGYYGSGG